MTIFAQILLAVVLGCSSTDLLVEWSRLAAPADGKVGAAAIVLETNTQVSLNSEEKFPMQSVYKVPIVMATLRRVDQGKLRLDQNVKLEAADLPPHPICPREAVGPRPTVSRGSPGGQPMAPMTILFGGGFCKGGSSV